MLAFFRSQHDNESWLAALTTILDASSLIIAGVDGISRHQAELTFAMARHAAVDLALVFRTPPRTSEDDRLPDAQWAEIRGQLAQAGFALREGGAHSQSKLTELRELYEPFVIALACTQRNSSAGAGGPQQSGKPVVEKTFDFEDAQTGKMPAGFTPGLTGGGGPVSWVVKEELGPSGGKKVLAQISSGG